MALVRKNNPQLKTNFKNKLSPVKQQHNSIKLFPWCGMFTNFSFPVFYEHKNNLKSDLFTSLFKTTISVIEAQ